jgi:hypothetical protein
LALDCAASAIAAIGAFSGLAELSELPIPASEVTTSKSAAKTASLSEIRKFLCLVIRNMIVSRVKFTDLVIG